MGLIGGWRNWTVEGLDSNFLLRWRLAAVPGAIETLLLAIGVAAALMLVFRSRQVEASLARGWPAVLGAAADAPDDVAPDTAV